MKKLLVLSLVCLIILVGGCGTQPTKNNDTQPSADNNNGSPPKQLGSVIIGKAVDSIGFSTVDIALKQGFFKQQGVDVKTMLLAGSSQTNAALTAGSIQFSAVSASALLLARENGVPLISVAGMDYGIPFKVVVRKGWMTSHNLSVQQPINDRIRGLSGMTLGQVGPTDLGYMKLLLHKVNISDSDIHVIKFQTQAAAAAAMTNGQIDAFVATPPSSVQLEEQGVGTILVNLKELPEMVNVALDILVTTEDYVQKNPEIVKAVASAVAQTDNFILDHPQETLAVEQEHFPNLSNDVLRKSLALCTFARNGQQDQTQWNNALQQSNEMGLLKGQVKAEQGKAWTNKFIDISKLGSK